MVTHCSCFEAKGSTFNSFGEVLTDYQNQEGMKEKALHLEIVTY